jgi:hypothetical protein
MTFNAPYSTLPRSLRVGGVAALPLTFGSVPLLRRTGSAPLFGAGRDGAAAQLGAPSGLPMKIKSPLARSRGGKLNQNL